MEFICQSKGFCVELLIFKRNTIQITKNWKIEITRSFFWTSYAIHNFLFHFFFSTTQSVKLFLCISIIMKSTPTSNIHICTTYIVSEHRRKEWKIDTPCRTWWHRFVNVKPLYMKTNVYLSYNTLVRLFMVSFTFLHFTLYLLLFSFENSASKCG